MEAGLFKPLRRWAPGRAQCLNFFGAANMSCGRAAPGIFIQTSHGKALFESLSIEASISTSGDNFTVMGFHREAMTIAVDNDEADHCMKLPRAVWISFLRWIISTFNLQVLFWTLFA